jgi:HEAT repeat protein
MRIREKVRPTTTDVVDRASDSTIRHSPPRSQRRIVIGGLALVLVAGTWLAVGNFGNSIFARFSGSKAGPSHVQTARSANDVSGRLSIADAAVMAVLGGVQAPEKVKLPGNLRSSGDGSDVDQREQELIKIIETGTDAEALAAIRELAGLGGALNRRRLSAIMTDSRWPAALRSEAARALLASENPMQARFAAKALAVIGGEENVTSLRAMITNESLPKPLRLEATLSMAIIGTPQARDALVGALQVFPEPEMHEQILGALGEFPFPQIEATWRQILSDPNTPAEVRVAAVDALAGSTSDALPFLKKVASSDHDPMVREMSAWAISALPGGAENDSLGPDLARMAAAEPDADVRRRLYEALPAQVNNPAESLLPVIQNETDYAARVAGFNALADTVKRGASSGLAAKFDAEIVPELTDIAVSNQTLDVRTRAVFALAKAKTPAALQALQTLSETPNQKIALAARHGLQTAK